MIPLIYRKHKINSFTYTTVLSCFTVSNVCLRLRKQQQHVSSLPISGFRHGISIFRIFQWNALILFMNAKLSFKDRNSGALLKISNSFNKWLKNWIKSIQYNFQCEMSFIKIFFRNLTNNLIYIYNLDIYHYLSIYRYISLPIYLSIYGH